MSHSSPIDAYLDEAVDRSLFEEKKLSLLMERKVLDERRGQIAHGQQAITWSISEFLEQVDTLPLTYEIGSMIEKRDILKTVTSNLHADRKNVVVGLRSPFQEVATLVAVPTGAPVRHGPRAKMKKVFELIVEHFTTQAKKRQRDDYADVLAA